MDEQSSRKYVAERVRLARGLVGMSRSKLSQTLAELTGVEVSPRRLGGIERAEFAPTYMEIVALTLVIGPPDASDFFLPPLSTREHEAWTVARARKTI